MPLRSRSAGRLPAVLLVCAGLLLAAADVKIPPAPGRWATDEAGFLAPSTVRALDARLETFERETGHQVLVYVGRSTGGIPIEEWAVKAFEAWKVGRKGLDDGLVLFIMADDRQVRIEVGYGLEDRVPDALAFQVIDRILLPGFREGHPDAAVSEAVSSLLSIVSGRDDAAPRAAPARSERGSSAVNMILVGIAVVFFIILFITNPSLALWLLFSIFSGGRGGGGRGGWGGGGGGFSGGGGRSGGGGASGSW
jgi:uncharacterized protein